MSGTEHTFTGDYYQLILEQQRFGNEFTYCKLVVTRECHCQAVVLAHRPPISIRRTTVSPALLEELLGEISSLSSVYHKPPETFMGRGRIGADSVQRKGTEYGALSSDEMVPTANLHNTVSMSAFQHKRHYKRLLLVSSLRTYC
jgi:hypothetical protein